MNCFVYGKWDNDKKCFIFDQGKIDKLRNRCTENMVHCKNCDVRQHCGGYCLGEVVNETGDMYGQKTIVCAAIHRLWDEIGLSNPYPFLHP